MAAEVRSMFPRAMLRIFQEFSNWDNPIMLDKENLAFWTKKVEFFNNSNRQRLIQEWVQIANRKEITMAIELLDRFSPNLGRAFEAYVRRNRNLLT